MNTIPNFGPYGQWESIAAFTAISEHSYTLFYKMIETHRGKLTRPTQHLVLRMAYQAKTTSLAARLNNSWAFNLPALALLRVRLEQLIVCSYLVHEEESIGLKPFVHHIPIARHKNLVAAMEDTGIAKHLANKVDLSKSENDAIQAQSILTPGFTINNDKFQRDWTNLDLRSMAKRRDKLAATKGPICSQKLESEYLSFYKTASSIIHADSSSLSYQFLDILAIGAKSPVLMPLPSWAILVSAGIAHYDLIQPYELLAWLGMPAEQEYQELMSAYLDAVKKYA